MNVFVLCTGRCGSATFIQACRHIRNYSSAHESRTHLLGEQRFAYPQRHIEADNRLSWLLGRLQRHYGDKARYVHLRRDVEQVAASHVRRYHMGIIRAYRGDGVLLHLPDEAEPMAVARDYCDTVNSNISQFLRDKSHTLDFQLENAEEDFPRFWRWIGAQGDLSSALAEFATRYNASPPG
jgi:hypothetical protein